MTLIAIHSLSAVVTDVLLDAGSCAITYEEEVGGPVTTEHQYFAKALQLRDQCNVLVRVTCSCFIITVVVPNECC